MAESRKRTIVINDQPHYDFVPTSGRRGRRIKRTKRTKTKEHSKSRLPRTTTKTEQVPAPEIIPNQCNSNATEGGHGGNYVVNNPVSDINVPVCYLQLLATHSAVTPVDEDYQAFLLQDIHINKKKLKDGYVIVQRQVVLTPNGLEWLYGCSSNPARQRMLQVLSCQLSHPVEKGTQLLQKHMVRMVSKGSQYNSDDLVKQSTPKSRYPSNCKKQLNPEQAHNISASTTTSTLRKQWVLPDPISTVSHTTTVSNYTSFDTVSEKDNDISMYAPSECTTEYREGDSFTTA